VTATREALIEKLVISLHLSVPERRLLGSECVSVEEVTAVVKRLLKQDGIFPPTARLWQPGEVVFEGFFLVKHTDGKFQMVGQRSNPIRPTELADRTSSEYDDLDDAVSQFIENAWSKGIDGIRLMRRSQPLGS
jgi:hypothetical protein